jgi:glycosyltransferase involved in cell wall biosynthesis
MTEADNSFGFGVNLIAYIRAEMGLGTAARGIAHALESAAVPFNVLNFEHLNPSLHRDDSWKHKEVNFSSYDFTILAVNPDNIVNAKAQVQKRLVRDRYTIGYWFWELPEIPDDWQSSFALVDEVWVASRFVQDAISLKSPVPVFRVPVPIRLGQNDKFPRQRFSLPERQFLFLSMADWRSHLARKNPLGAIRAFKKAFPRDNTTAGLIVKINNASALGSDQETLTQIRAEMEGCPNIYLLDSEMTRPEVDSLLAISDCFVSLHRSEGFGLGPAEAMSLGKPVILTKWSGNLDYMTPDNSIGIDYQLVPVGRQYGPYQPDQVWADPDLKRAASWMKRLVKDPEFGKKIGLRGQETIKKEFSPEAVGKVIQQRLNYLRRGMVTRRAASTQEDSDISADLEFFASRGGTADPEPSTSQRPFIEQQMRARVTVGVPIYRGKLYLEESLASVRDQTYPEMEVIMSLDGPDPECEEICRKFLTDSRFRLVIQPLRLGWLPHTNWLMSRVQTDFWHLQEQDDVIEPTFLETLVRYAAEHPDVAAAYTDLRAFGTVDYHMEMSPVIGSPVIRQLKLIYEHFSGVAPLGLIRTEALRRSGGLHVNEVENFAADTAFMAGLARWGELHRLPVELYRKRVHAESTCAKWPEWPTERQFTAWQVHCLDMLRQAFLIDATPHDRRLLWLAVIERLVAPRRASYFQNTAELTVAERADVLDSFLTRARTSSIDITGSLVASLDEIESWTRGYYWVDVNREISGMEKLSPETVSKISLEVSAVPQEARVSAVFWLDAKVTNPTNETLSPAAAFPVRLAYHWLQKATRQMVVFDGKRSELFPLLEANGTARYPMTVVAPNQPGEYILQTTMVQDGVCWFENIWPGIVQEFPVSVTA